MKLTDISPFVRYAGHISGEILGKFSKMLRACDHRFFVIERGEAVILAGENEYSLGVGSMLFVRSGVHYRYLFSSSDISIFSFNFDLTRQNADVSFPIPPDNAEQAHERALFEGEGYAVEEFSDVFVSFDGEAPALAARIEREYRNGALFYETRCGHMLADLLALAARRAARNDERKTLRLAEKVTGYIHENYASDLSNEAIARAFSYHPGYLNRLTVEYTGMSLHQYVNRTRVNYALALLEGGSYSVSEVASMVGFSDLVHFSKTFRKLMGRSPSAYRPKK